jgi:hypothetical protein
MKIEDIAQSLGADTDTVNRFLSEKKMKAIHVTASTLPDVVQSFSQWNGGAVATVQTQIQKSAQPAPITTRKPGRLSRNLTPVTEPDLQIPMPAYQAQIARVTPEWFGDSGQIVQLAQQTATALQKNSDLAALAGAARAKVDDDMVCQLLASQLTHICESFNLTQDQVFEGSPEDRLELWNAFIGLERQRQDSARTALEQILNLNPAAQFRGQA